MPKIKPNSEADEYTKQMNAFLQENPYPSDAKLKKISELMGKSMMQIYMWFANNRHKHGINVGSIYISFLLDIFLILI